MAVNILLNGIIRRLQLMLETIDDLEALVDHSELVKDYISLIVSNL